MLIAALRLLALCAHFVLSLLARGAAYRKKENYMSLLKAMCRRIPRQSNRVSLSPCQWRIERGCGRRHYTL